MLHIINKSPFQTSSLDTCLGMALPGHALLFTEDGIYATTQGSSVEARLREACATLKVYVLQPDLEARGVASRLIEGVTPVGYDGFVDLAVEFSTSHSWL